MQKCAHEGKSDARVEDSVTNDVYQTLVAERSQDAEALAAEDADNAREQQPFSHRTLRPILGPTLRTEILPKFSLSCPAHARSVRVPTERNTEENHGDFSRFAGNAGLSVVQSAS
jgi:hypothetical protein